MAEGWNDSKSHASYWTHYGEQGQRWSDPLYHILGGEDGAYARTVNDYIPRHLNRALSKIAQPIDDIDQKINPLRKIPAVDNFFQGVSNKPVDAIAAVLAAMFAIPAMAGAAGGSAGSAAGGAGTGTGLTQSFFGGGGPTAGFQLGNGAAEYGFTPSYFAEGGGATGTAGGATGGTAGAFNWRDLMSQGLKNYGSNLQKQSEQPGQGHSVYSGYDDPPFVQPPKEEEPVMYSPVASNALQMPQGPMGYNDPNNPGYVTNSMNPYALNPMAQGLYGMGAIYG